MQENVLLSECRELDNANQGYFEPGEFDTFADIDPADLDDVIDNGYNPLTFERSFN